MRMTAPGPGRVSFHTAWARAGRAIRSPIRSLSRGKRTRCAIAALAFLNLYLVRKLDVFSRVTATSAIRSASWDNRT